MTRGISEESLLEIRNTCDARDRYAIDLILKECTELNPWLPIETSPKDRRILLFYPGNGHYSKKIGQYMIEVDEFISDGLLRIRPTHWCELPDDPK